MEETINGKRVDKDIDLMSFKVSHDHFEIQFLLEVVLIKVVDLLVWLNVTEIHEGTNLNYFCFMDQEFIVF